MAMNEGARQSADLPASQFAGAKTGAVVGEQLRLVRRRQVNATAPI